jgi:NTE family protein
MNITNDEIKNRLDNYISKLINEKDPTINYHISSEYDDIPIYKSNGYKHIKKIVASGGGTRGYGLIGALHALEENGILNNIEEFVGVSAGASVLAFYVMGMSPLMIHHFLRSFELSKMQQLSIKNLSNFGLDNGQILDNIINKALKKTKLKKDITLLELFNMTGKKMIFGTVNVNKMQYEYISYATHPNVTLMMALRMTTCIPLVFTPINYNGNLYIDGGVMNNMPMEYYHDKLDDVLGLYLYYDDKEYNTIDGLYDYFSCVANCFLKNGVDTKIKSYARHIIFIELNTDFLDFNMDNKVKDTMFIDGYKIVLREIK